MLNFMINLCVTSEETATHFQGIFHYTHQRLMVLFSHTSANIRHFSFGSDSSSVCMRWAGMCASSLLSPPHTHSFPKSHGSLEIMLNLTFTYAWAPSLSPFPQWNVSELLFPSAVSWVQISFVCTCSNVSFT